MPILLYQAGKFHSTQKPVRTIRDIQRLQQSEATLNSMKFVNVDIAPQSIVVWLDYFGNNNNSKLWEVIEMERCNGNLDVFLQLVVRKTKRLVLKRILRNDDAVFSLSLGLKFNKTLHSLEISRTDFSLRQAEAFADGLKKIKHLKALTLRHIEFNGSACSEAIASGIRENTSLLAISVALCTFSSDLQIITPAEAETRPQSGLEILLEPITSHPHIQALHVHLSAPQPQPLDAQNTTATPTPSSSTQLPLRAIVNWLNAPRSQAKNLSIRTSSTRENSTTSETTTSNLQQHQQQQHLRNYTDFCTALRNSKSLGRFIYSGNDLEDEDLPILADILKHNSNLIGLKIDSSSIQTLAPLTSALQYDNKTLQDLEVVGRSLSESSITKFAKVLPLMPGLKRLKLYAPTAFPAASSLSSNSSNTREPERALMEALESSVNLENLVIPTCTSNVIRIHHLTSMNRAGRRVLRHGNIPPALWPRLLERSQKLKYYHLEDKWMDPKCKGIRTNVLYGLLRGAWSSLFIPEKEEEETNASRDENGPGCSLISTTRRRSKRVRGREESSIVEEDTTSSDFLQGNHSKKARRS